MDPPDPGHQGGGQGDQVPQVLIVDASDYRGHQGHAHLQLRTDLEGRQLGLEEGASPEKLVDFLPGAVKL